MRRPLLSSLRVLIASLCCLVVSRAPAGTSPATVTSRASLAGEGTDGARLAAGWYGSGWRHRVKITANPALVQGTLLDFPLLVDGSSLTSVFARAKSDGSDILITKRDGVTRLDHEIVGYDAGAHKAEIWFAADSLSASVREFFIYYDNPGATVSPAGSVWNGAYAAVYHFEEDPGLGTLQDYTAGAHDANARNAAAAWTSGDVMAGQCGQAWRFNGTTHFINTRAIRIPDSTYVISAWLRHTTRTTDFTFQSNPNFWHVSSQTNNIVQRPHYNLANPWRDLRWDPTPIPLNEFHYFTWVFDGVADTVYFYWDGERQPATPWAADPGVTHFYTGIPINPAGNFDVGICGPMYWNGDDLMTGAGDEFRISSGLHGAAWIGTEYANQRDPGTFFTAAAEESGTPVTLQSFTAVRTSAGALLRWQVVSPSADHLGFRVHRDDGAVPWTLVSTGLLSGQETYEWLDPQSPASSTDYWLAEETSSGRTFWYGPAVLAPALAEALVLEPSRPNPILDTTTLRFSTGRAGGVQLRVIDVRGREVRRLFDAVADPGHYVVHWDGRDDQGQRLRAGIYILRLDGPEGTRARKLLLM